MKKWKVLSSRQLLKSKYMRILEQRARMQNGKVAYPYYLIEKNDVALIFAMTRQEKVILVREYKHGAGEVLLQLPVGFMEKGEKPERAALRELEEETGYSGKSAELIGKFISSPSDSSNRIFLFLVEDAAKTASQKLDETVEIEVELMGFPQVLAAVKNGKIKVMPHVAAMLLMKERLRKGKK